MTVFECVFTIMVVLVCGAGLSWLFYDINKTIKHLDKIETEKDKK